MSYPDFDPMLPIVALDFDGILVTSEWPDPRIGMEILEGTKCLRHYYEAGAEVVIFTARPESHFERIWEWLRSKGIDHMVYDVTGEKPRASVYIDDRAWRPPWAT